MKREAGSGKKTDTQTQGHGETARNASSSRQSLSASPRRALLPASSPLLPASAFIPASCFTIPASCKEAITLQKTLAAQVRIQPLPTRIKIIAAADISYSRQTDLLIAVIVSFKWPGLQLIESAHHVCRAAFPYVPGLLSFREVPPLIGAYEKIKRKPDVLLCDGQGIAHPRKVGFASHLGLCLGIPTVGCAKSRLCGDHDNLPLKKGSSRPLVLDGEQLGIVYRSKHGVKPIYISPGHLSDIPSSKSLISRCLRRFRIPEPLRLAHIEANKLRAACGDTESAGKDIFSRRDAEGAERK